MKNVRLPLIVVLKFIEKKQQKAICSSVVSYGWLTRLTCVLFIDARRCAASRTRQTLISDRRLYCVSGLCALHEKSQFIQCVGTGAALCVKGLHCGWKGCTVGERAALCVKGLHCVWKGCTVGERACFSNMLVDFDFLNAWLAMCVSSQASWHVSVCHNLLMVCVYLLLLSSDCQWSKAMGYLTNAISNADITFN